VPLPTTGQVHALAVAADQNQPAGQAPILHIAGEVPVDPGQPPGVEPGLASLDLNLEPPRPIPLPPRVPPRPGQPRPQPRAPPAHPPPTRPLQPVPYGQSRPRGGRMDKVMV